MKLTDNMNTEKARDTGSAIVLILLLLELFLGTGLYFKLAIPVLVINMTVPRLFLPLAYVWFGFAHIMGTMLSKVLLFLVYGILVFPVGMIRRMGGHDALQLKKWKGGTNTVFITRNHQFSANDIEKPY